jgi:hypothetical protein
MKEKHKSYHTQMKKKTGYTSPNGLNVNWFVKKEQCIESV